ncbi:hypothetical protein RRG08_035719 [Elysia crispata]|uniref:Uncharacterized protein n=1 Tax=Elysia crispata TaxID=231223 RepID=A0AAE1D048_9GAST|nr:hypothetical protein RRG08_035719 [Elysia crispata]
MVTPHSSLYSSPSPSSATAASGTVSQPDQNSHTDGRKNGRIGPSQIGTPNDGLLHQAGFVGFPRKSGHERAGLFSESEKQQQQQQQQQQKHYHHQRQHQQELRISGSEFYHTDGAALEGGGGGGGGGGGSCGNLSVVSTPLLEAESPEEASLCLINYTSLGETSKE